MVLLAAAKSELPEAYYQPLPRPCGDRQMTCEECDPRWIGRRCWACSWQQHSRKWPKLIRSGPADRPAKKTGWDQNRKHHRNGIKKTRHLKKSKAGESPNSGSGRNARAANRGLECSAAERRERKQEQLGGGRELEEESSGKKKVAEEWEESDLRTREEEREQGEGIYSLGGTLLFRCLGTENQTARLDRAAETLAVRREFVAIVGDQCLLSVERAAQVLAGSDALERRECCENCDLPVGPTSFVLQRGDFGTGDWRHRERDAIGEIAEEVSRDFLCWSGDNTFCNVCWSTRAFLFAFDEWRQEPEGFLKLLRMYWGRDVPAPGRWIDLLSSMFARIDELEEEEDPSLAARRIAMRERCKDSDFARRIIEKFRQVWSSTKPERGLPAATSGALRGESSSDCPPDCPMRQDGQEDRERGALRKGEGSVARAGLKQTRREFRESLEHTKREFEQSLELIKRRQERKTRGEQTRREEPDGIPSVERGARGLEVTPGTPSSDTKSPGPQRVNLQRVLGRSE